MTAPKTLPETIEEAVIRWLVSRVVSELLTAGSPGAQLLESVMSEIRNKADAILSAVNETKDALASAVTTAETRIREDVQSLKDRLANVPGVDPEDIAALDAIPNVIRETFQPAIVALSAIDPDTDTPNSV